MASLHMPQIAEPLTGSPGPDLGAVDEPRGDHCQGERRAMHAIARIQFITMVVVKRETET